MRQRTISDYFWRDPKLCNLSQEDKATLLFFLTSPSSNIIGVYQVVWAIAGAEMGWTKDQLLVVVKRLKDRGLINFKDDGWIFVKIWWEHNSAPGAFSPKLKKKAINQCEAMPSEWLQEFLTLLDALKLIELNRVSIGYSYSMDTLRPNTTTTCNANSIITTTKYGTCNSDLIYPQMSPDDNKSISDLIRNQPIEVQQLILDELAGAIKAKKIKGGLVAYTHGLISAAKAGRFTPSLGISILDSRKKEQMDRTAHILAKPNFELYPDAIGNGEQMFFAAKSRAAIK